MYTDNSHIRHNIIKPQHGIEIRYSHISDLMNSIFPKPRFNCNNFNAQHSIIFKENDFHPGIFSCKELKTVNSFKALKKQIEWMAGRCLIKYMVLEYFLNSTPQLQSTAASQPTNDGLGDRLNPPESASPKNKKKTKIKPHDIIISHHDEGAPFLEKWPFLKISISHSGKYAAAAICFLKNREIGLDIEKTGKVPDSFFMKLAFTKNEIANLRHYRHDPEDYLQCSEDRLGHQCSEEIFKKWTLKEAFLKYIKKGFNESLHRVEILDNQIFHNGSKANVSIFSTIIKNGTQSRYSLSMVS